MKSGQKTKSARKAVRPSPDAATARAQGKASLKSGLTRQARLIAVLEAKGLSKSDARLAVAALVEQGRKEHTAAGTLVRPAINDARAVNRFLQ